MLDRTGLILEIFGERAATREGVLQVELAHLNYQKGRLVRSWTHLERQRGGFGFLGGPGETQIESDRRLLAGAHRAARGAAGEGQDAPAASSSGGATTCQFPIVALVGYTNAGKSSLFNTLTGAGVFAKDLLFATLDTTVRKLELPHGREVMLSDTVGFVADLPTIWSPPSAPRWRRCIEADVILHVRDVANPDHAAQAQDVLKVLGELGVSAEKTPIIEVWNKIDLLRATPMAARGAAADVAPVGQGRGRGAGLGADRARGSTRCSRRSRRRWRPRAAPTMCACRTANGADVGWLYGHAEIIAPSRRAGRQSGSDAYEVRGLDPRRQAPRFDAKRFAGRDHREVGARSGALPATPCPRARISFQ